MTSRLYEFFYKETPEEREREYLGDLLVQPRSTKEIRAYVLADYLLGRHRKLSEDLFKQREQMYRSATHISLLTGLVTGTTLALAYLFVAFRGVAGTIDPGGVVLVIGAFTAVSGTLGQISSTFVAVDQHTTFLDDYFSFLAIEPLVPVPAEPHSAPSLAHRIGHERHRVRQCHFHLSRRNGAGGGGLEPAHPPRRTDRAGGRERSGKSTLDQVAASLLRCRSRIGARGRRRSEGSRSRGSAQPHRRAVSGLRELRIVGPRERRDGPARAGNADDERVMEALRNSRSEWLVKKMPNGLDSKVGRLFEGGHDLSGGEWQRLALARIMYRDADIWILDEPTSSLDPEAEAAIFAELKENLKGRIGIVISHRFSTVRIADRIAVIADGQVSELGTHEELLAGEGALRATV